MRSKKADISSTILWVLASFVLVFAGIIYVTYILGMGGLKTMNRDDKIKLYHGGANDISLLNSYYSFLNGEIEIDSKKMKVADLVKFEPETDKANFLEFKKRANEFMDNYIMPISETGSGRPLKGEVRVAWLRIYGFDEETKVFDTAQDGLNVKYDRYYDYNVRREKTAMPCNPKGPDSNTFYYILPNNKRIVMCVEYEK